MTFWAVACQHTLSYHRLFRLWKSLWILRFRSNSYSDNWHQGCPTEVSNSIMATCGTALDPKKSWWSLLSSLTFIPQCRHNSNSKVSQRKVSVMTTWEDQVKVNENYHEPSIVLLQPFKLSTTFYPREDHWLQIALILVDWIIDSIVLFQMHCMLWWCYSITNAKILISCTNNGILCLAIYFTASTKHSNSY